MKKPAKSNIWWQALILVVVMALIAVVFVVNNSSSNTNSQNQSEGHQLTIDDFAEARVAVVIGTTSADAAVESWPKATLFYYSTVSDVITALNTGKVDCAAISNASYASVSNEHDNLARLEKPIDKTPKPRGFAFPKGSTDTTYYKQFNEFIEQCKQDGTIDELIDIWLGSDFSRKTVPDYSTLSATNGTLNLIASADEEPYNYWNGDKLAGFDIDFVYRFAKAYGYGLNIDVTPFESLILGLRTGTYDFAAESLSMTEERALAIDYSISVCESSNIVVFNTNTIESFIGEPVVLPEVNNANKSASLFDTLARVFLTGDRWKLVVDGLKVTVIITIAATLLATLLAYGLVQARRLSKRAGNTLVNLYVKLFQGTPVLVMLLIFYYVVFGRADVPAIIIATLVFAMNSAAYIEEALYADICSVDPGQREAALAAGYTEHQTFLRFILPPAITKVMPVYRGEIISLMKSTSIVGYVALIDLTKAGDIVRSQTYEAVIPLVSIAIVYLIMSWLISIGMTKIERKLTPPKPLMQIKKVDMSAMERFDEEAAAERPLVDAMALGEPGEVLIEIKHLRKEYPNVVPLKDVNATIRRGDVISIIGPSGTGKSTLLRMLNQLEMPTSGDVYLEGQCITDDSCDINEVRQKMGMVFQSFNLYERLCVAENIMVAPVTLRDADRQETFERALELLERVDLRAKALNYPSELSGGQKQRVAIVRALAMDSDILLLDEPTSALDPKMVGEVQRVILQLAQAGMTMMIVTHEMSFARKVSNRIFYMDEGVIYEEGTPEQIFEHPQRPKTRDFVYNLNKVEATISSADTEYVEFAKELEKFAVRNLLSPKACYRINMLYEEVVLNGIIAHVTSKTQVHMVVEYSEESETILVRIDFKGKNMDPLAMLDDLAQTLVTHCTNGYEHRYEDGVNFINVKIG